MPRNRDALCCLVSAWLCLFSGPLSADIPPPPIVSVKALSSSGCPQAELERAVAARRSEVRSCLERSLPRPLPIECRFNETWRAKVCTFPEGIEKRAIREGAERETLRCVLEALSKMVLHQPKDSPPPSGCVANIQIESRPGRSNRVRRSLMDLF